MIALAHLLVVLILIRLFRLDQAEAFAAMLFGVLIDIDHVFGMVDFISLRGWGDSFNLSAALTADVQWKSLFHSPIAAAIVLPASVGFRMAVPLLAWGLHLLMDWVQIEYLGVLSMVEMILMLVLFAVLLVLEKRDLDSNGQKHTYLMVVQNWARQVVEGISNLTNGFRRSLGLLDTSR
ncbi:MAG: hypothetical protein GX307_07380 [Euryarchaeota archaeon]|nr:hypothetical protein [Euryarchaeota archaeon]